MTQIHRDLSRVSNPALHLSATDSLPAQMWATGQKYRYICVWRHPSLLRCRYHGTRVVLVSRDSSNDALHIRLVLSWLMNCG